jgi:signal transduction histidine kinase
MSEDPRTRTISQPVASEIHRQLRELHQTTQAALSSSEERLKLALEAAEKARWRLELLARAGTVLSGSLDPHQTLTHIASIVVPEITDWVRVDLVDADGVLRRALTHHSDPERARLGTELAAKLRAAPDAVGSMSWVVRTGRSHLVHFDPPHALDEIRDRDLLTFARTIGLSAYFIVPLIARGRTLGALAALQAESGRKLGEEDCALISEIAQRAALALDNARLYAEAEAALRQAETASRAKDEFLAMLGHELRNPLAPIVTALQLMKMRNPTEAKEERGIIERQVTHLLRLVDDLLDVSRITKGKVQLAQERVDLRAVVSRALEQTQPMLEKRVLPVEVSLPDVPVVITGDSVRLAQVISNLLTNAAKFTPPDKRLALEMRVEVDWVEIAVIDEGIGIAPALLPHVFELFLQGDQPIDRHSGGLGLGLAIVSSLVHMHGGSVRADSEGSGKGSTFTVRLPATGGGAVSAPVSSDPLPEIRGSGRVLVVDDNTDALKTLAELLRQVGYEVRAVGDGHAALAELASFTPDLAVLDIGLPGMDGYELARRLREHPGLSALRLVALTGYGRELDRLRAMSAQFHEHLVKPVPAARLLDAVGALLQRPG